jgi:hypothetical protein
VEADIQFETRDKQGNLVRYNADDDDQTLGELVRQERFGAGSAEQKSLDAAMAGAIAGDARYQVSSCPTTPSLIWVIWGKGTKLI